MRIFVSLAGASGLVFLSEIISRYLAPVLPGSIISIILLTLLLFTGVVRLESFSSVSSFFLENLSFFLIPAFAASAELGRYTGTGVVKILVLIFTATAVVMTVTGLCAQLLINVFHPDENASGGDNGKDDI